MRIKPFEGAFYSGYTFWCPACEMRHTVVTKKVADAQVPVWGFDGNQRYPTFDPSIRVNYGTGSVCHLHVKYGMLVYCADCTHVYAGQTHPMVEMAE